MFRQKVKQNFYWKTEKSKKRKEKKKTNIFFFYTIAIPISHTLESMSVKLAAKENKRRKHPDDSWWETSGTRY